MTPRDKALQSFTEYCKAHPTERFWQALRNWCGWPFVLVCENKDHVKGPWEDTFYWEDVDWEE